MGAYENPVTVVDDKSALIMAQGFQSFSSQLTKAFLDQQKKEEELAAQKLVDADNLIKASQLSTKEMQKRIDKNLEKLGNVGDLFVEYTRGSLMKEADLDSEITGMTVRTNEDLERKKELQKEYNALSTANSSKLSDIQDLDTLSQKEAKESSTEFLTRKAGEIDNLDPRNTAFLKANNILKGITSLDGVFTEKYNKLGENILTFYPEGEESFDLNISRLQQDTHTVSNMFERLDTTLTKGDNPMIVAAKGGIKPSDEFLLKEEDGTPKYKYSTKILPDGTKVTYRTPQYDMASFNAQFVSSVTTTNNQEQDDYGRMSAFNHFMAGTMDGQEVTYKNAKGENQTVTINANAKKGPLTFTLSDQGELSEDQRLLYAATVQAYAAAKYKFVPEAEEYYKKYLPADKGTPPPSETPEDKAKNLYNAYKEDPVSYYQEYLGVKPIYDSKANTMTVPADEEAGRTKAIVWDLNNVADRNNFYAKIFENSPSGKGDSKEVRVLNEAFADIVRSSSKIEVAKKEWINNWLSSNAGKTKEDAEAAYEKIKKYSNYKE